MNLPLIDELARLRFYLESNKNSHKSDYRSDFYEQLGISKDIWNGLVVIGPGNMPVMLPSVSNKPYEEKNRNAFHFLDGKQIKSLYFGKIIKKVSSKLENDQFDKSIHGNNHNIPTLEVAEINENIEIEKFAGETREKMYRDILMKTLNQLRARS